MYAPVIFIEKVIKNNLYKFKGKLLKLYLTAHGCQVGRGLRCVSWPYFRSVPNKNFFWGNHVSIGKHITFQGEGKFIFRDHVRLTQDILISAASEVYIGQHTGLAENVSIRDSDHGFAAEATIWHQDTIAEPIRIGDDVQISVGCAIFRGATIEDGAIIGAYAIVTRNAKIVKNGIYLGSPPKLIGKRV